MADTIGNAVSDGPAGSARKRPRRPGLKVVLTVAGLLGLGWSVVLPIAGILYLVDQLG